MAREKTFLVIESLETWRAAGKAGLSIGSESWLSTSKSMRELLLSLRWVVHQKCEARNDLLNPLARSRRIIVMVMSVQSRGWGNHIRVGADRELRY